MKYIEFGGGLGDVINQCYRFGGYSYLSKTAEKTAVLIFCHNQFCVEIFNQHANAVNFEIKYQHYPTFPVAESIRQDMHRNGYVRTTPPVNHKAEDIKFYPTPADMLVLESLPANYVSFQPFSGTSDRDIPPQQIQAIDEFLSSINIPLVMIGRNYDRTHKTSKEGTDSKTIISTIDKLSVPGTIELVKRSRLFIGGHSSMNLLAWHNHKPNYILIPPAIETQWFAHQNEWVFGKDYPESKRDVFSTFNLDKIKQLLGA